MRNFEGPPLPGGEGEHPEQQLTADLEQRLFVREVPPEYIKLIGNVQLIELIEPYSDTLNLILREDDMRPLVEQKFRDEVVVDLGCGQSHSMYSLSRKCGASLYIGVDLRPGHIQEIEASEPVSLDIEQLREMVRRFESDPHKSMAKAFADAETEALRVLNTTKAKRAETNGADPVITQALSNLAYVKGDMLNFVSRLPDESIGVFISSGIEELPFSPKGYMPALVREVNRALKPGGIIIKYASDMFPKKDVTKKIVTIPDRYGDEGGIFEKRTTDDNRTA